MLLKPRIVPWVRESCLTEVYEKIKDHAPKELRNWSGWKDSNLRHSAPKTDALTGLRYTPNVVIVVCFFEKSRKN